MKRLDRSEIIFKVLAYVLLTLFAIACLYPFVYLVSASISSVDAMDKGAVYLWPVGFQIKAYEKVFSDSLFWLAYCNTLFYTMYGTLVSMLVGITGAYALSKSRLMFGRGFNFLLTFTMWFSAGLIPTYYNFKSLGVDNRYMYIIGLGFNAFNIILLRNYFSSVSTEIEEAATIDGASEFQLLTRIYIPMSKASIATVAMFYAISRWNGYLWAQMLLGAKDQPLQVYIRNTLTQVLEMSNSAGVTLDYSPYSMQYALLVCSILPIIIIYPKIQKYFAAGVNVGGVKE
ncbi:MAG: carbohydrate ABC transporter permease [Roseburia sp.]|nr:carbohydrate ABC transporter permease [Anaeroplasma bactoclasticum]MCM1196456.1 carbohydrate ABC transporter permease [Roseburia sp.]MCM1556572.1 carbohydrate ABC transporter permease [Anaeroplasma bactoclasticum]